MKTLHFVHSDLHHQHAHISARRSLHHKLKGVEALRDISDRRASLAELKKPLGGQLGLGDGGVVVLGPVGEVHNVGLGAARRLLHTDRRRTTDHLPVVEPITQPAERPVAQAHIVAAAAVLLVADGAALGTRVAAGLEVPVPGDGAEGAAAEEGARVDAAARVWVVVAADLAATAGAAPACELEVQVDGRGGRGEEGGDEGEGLHVA